MRSDWGCIYQFANGPHDNTLLGSDCKLGLGSLRDVPWISWTYKIVQLIAFIAFIAFLSDDSVHVEIFVEQIWAMGFLQPQSSICRYDAALKGPEIINERMSATQVRSKESGGHGSWLVGCKTVKLVIFTKPIVSSTWYHLCIPLLFLFRSFTADSLFDSLGRFNREITFWRPVWSSVCGDVVYDMWMLMQAKSVQISNSNFFQVTQPTSWHRATSSEGVCYGATDAIRNQDTTQGFESEKSFFHWTRNLHLCRSQGISTLNQVGRTQDRNRARNWCHYCTFGIQVGMVLLGSTGWPKLLSSVNGQGELCTKPLNLLCLCCNSSQTIQLSMSLSGTEAMKIKSSQTLYLLDQRQLRRLL